MKQLLLATALLAAIAQAGCSAIASRDPGPAPCEISGGVDPCPAPLTCVNGHCMGSCAMPTDEVCDGHDNDCNGMIDDGAMCPGDAPCIRGECRSDCTTAELCNGRDDDCDGMIDETLDVDNDADGYVLCNVQNPSQSDCNDRSADIHPGAMELCNGFDDDCDPTTMDLNVHCPVTGEICAVPTGETLPRCFDPHDCRLFPCGANQLCGSDNTCCTMGTSGCGAPADCRTDGCPSTQRCAMMGTSSMTFACVDLTPLGGDCLADRDCMSGHCYTRAALDLTGNGSVCGSACCSDADCSATAGAICWAPGTGARSCVVPSALSGVDHSYHLCTRRTNNGCASGEECVPRSITLPNGGTGAAWVCGMGSSQTCAGFRCPSGTCDNQVFPLYCINPCGNATDCGSIANACTYVSAGGQWVTACVASDGSAGGTSCGNDSDCRDGLCLGGACADTCCSDASCGAGTCSPIDHSGWEMRCIPRAPI